MEGGRTWVWIDGWINAEGLDVEELELEFIDFGAEEVFEDEDGIHIYAPFENFGSIQK